MYVTALVDTLAKLNKECKDWANECYLATSYLMSSDRRCFGKLLDKMENNYSRGNDQCIHTLVKSHQLIITWKYDNSRISPGLSSISYTTLDNKSYNKTSGKKMAPYNPNWTCHLCGGKEHLHMECPEKNEWDKFCHSSHSQIEDDIEEEYNTATTIQ